MAMMIRIPLDSFMIDDAKRRAEKLGSLDFSILRGNGNLTGMLGEVALSKFLGCPIDNTSHYDIPYNGYKLEVKTKLTTVVPNKTYEGSVAASGSRQTCTHYVFTRALWPRGGSGYTDVYIMGFIERLKFFEESTFIKSGDVDPTNQFMASVDCYNIEYSRLDPILNLFGNSYETI
jgi:hypothetical protein